MDNTTNCDGASYPSLLQRLRIEHIELLPLTESELRLVISAREVRESDYTDFLHGTHFNLCTALSGRWWRATSECVERLLAPSVSPHSASGLHTHTVEWSEEEGASIQQYRSFLACVPRKLNFQFTPTPQKHSPVHQGVVCRSADRSSLTSGSG